MTHQQFAPEWAGVSGVFGGKVIADAAEAACAVSETAGLHLASVQAEFTGGGVVGPVEFAPRLVHRGRSTATVEVVCRQLQRGVERRVLGAVAKFVSPVGASVLAPTQLAPTPAPDQVSDFVPPWGELAYDQKFEVRLIAHDDVDGVPATRAWVRARPGAGLGPQGTVVALLDVLPPGLFMRGPRPSFVPTIDFSMHRDVSLAVREGEWLLGVMRTEWATDEFCLETATLHRADGRFVARGTQTRRVVR